MKQVIILLFMLGCLFAKSQQLNIDSCLNKLATLSNTDTNKVILLDKIAFDISFKNLQKGLDYSLQSLLLAKQLQFERYYGKINNTLGLCYLDLSEQGKSINCFMQGLDFAKKYHQNAIEANIYNSLGNLYFNREEFNKSLECYIKSAELHKKSNNVTALYTPYTNIGNVYVELHKSDSAIYYLNKCIEYNLKHNDKASLINNYMSLAELSINEKNENKSLFYASGATAIARELKENYVLAQCLIQLGNAYELKKNISKAFDSYNESVALAKHTGDLHTLQIASNYLSKLYESEHNFEKALYHFKDYKHYADNELNVENLEQIRVAEAKFLNQAKQKEIELMVEKQKLNESERIQQKQYLYFALAGIIGLALLLITAFKINRNKHRINLRLESFNKQINTQKELVERKNQEITDSIHYAKRLQQSILTSDSYLKKHTSEFFILFKPKDIVSGDFYWGLQHNNRFLFMTADCTGHGVPGAMMSVLGINLLNEIVLEQSITEPAAILNKLRYQIIKALNADDSEIETKDGMDCSLCSFDYNTMKLSYSNANNVFYIFRDGKCIKSEVNKMPIGAGYHANIPFKNFEIDLQKDDVVILFTDGIADQFGGPNGKKFKYNQLESILTKHIHLPLPEIKQEINKIIDEWQGNLEQVDDICIAGIKI